jgi:hypothetical protein
MREYSLGSLAATTTTGITITGASTLNYIVPAASPTANIEYLRHAVGQAANATSAQQRIQFGYKVYTSGSGFTTTSPAAIKRIDPASVIAGAAVPAAGKCGTGVSTDAEATGTITVLIDDNFNVLNGYLFVATPPECMTAPAGDTTRLWQLWFPTAPGTVTGWNWYEIFREV